jgi:putative hydrolase of the HAD superfamily
MIKNIVFDIGNVLINFKPVEFLRERFQDEAVVEAVYKTIFQSKEWPNLDRGTITEEEATENFCRYCSEYENEIREAMRDWHSILTPIEATVDIFKELKQKEYKIYVLSNYHMKAFESTYNNNEFFKLADGMVVSYKINMLKPEPEIYDYLLKEYSLKAKETLFIDDTLVNVEGANKAGIKTICFTSAEALREELESLELL